MPNQNVTYSINVNLDTDGGFCNGPSGEESDFNIQGSVMTCPDTAEVSVSCTGTNCTGTANVWIGYQCGLNDSDCGNYDTCGNFYYGDLDLNCICDVDPGASNYLRWQNLGGCIEDGTNQEYNYCGVKSVCHMDDCGNNYCQNCGTICVDDEFTICVDDVGAEVSEYGTCTCAYECPTNCASGYSCDFYQGPTGNGGCNNTNNLNPDGMVGDCGSCPTIAAHANCFSCDDNSQCCDYINRNLYNIEQGTPTIEIGNNEIHESRIKWRRGYNGSSGLYIDKLIIQVQKISSNQIWELVDGGFETPDSNSCTDFYLISGAPNDTTGKPTSLSVSAQSTVRLNWIPEQFFNNIEGDVQNVISDCGIYPSTCNDFRIIVSSESSSQTRFSNFVIKDDIRAGCTDSLADNYNPDSTYDDGSCEYTGCTDSNASNYSCGADNADPNLRNSYACGTPTDSEQGGNGYNYTISDMNDNGLCEFYPVAQISHSPASLNEGNDIEISALGSITHDNGEYACGECVGNLTYTWVITDTESPPNNYTSFISNTHTLNFPVPIMEGISQGGGALITVGLSVQNEQGWINTHGNYIIEIGDVDIIGTQLSSFPSIYIPGGDTYTLIGCYLPPDEVGYDMGNLLDSSFFLPTTNPDTPDVDLVLNSYMTGDLAYIIQCENEDCLDGGDNLNNGFFNYISGIGWIGPDIKLTPGMGIKLQTENSGWFRWTLPSE